MLSSVIPTDASTVSELPARIREDRAEMNKLISTVELAAGTTTIDVSSVFQNVDLETVILSAAGACTLATMTKGTSGQILIFHFQDGNIDITDGVKSDGKFFLNQVALTDFTAAQDDILALVNIGGNGDDEPGYWKELWRAVDVK